MSVPDRIRGVLSPVVTPFDKGLKPDATKLLAQCKWLLQNDVGLAVFGTNSEANSLSASEKIDLLDALVEGGLPAGRMMPGTGACALPDTIRMTKHAVAKGCGGVLMLPPFYYKGVSDEGLYRSYADVIEAVGDPKLRIYLYHIPPVSGVPISFNLIERLLKDYPGIIAGVKDSSGDWANTSAMLERFQPQGFDVFAGSETFLLQTMRAGGAGCISATANVNPAAISMLYHEWQSADAEAQQAALDATRSIFAGYVMIPALKAAVARFSQDRDWLAVRPPLVPFDAEQESNLAAALDRIGFAMPGLDLAHA